MRWPGADEMVFSLKAFAAAMAAFGIACWLDLPRPIWAVFTVYIVMQPLSGAVRSKAWYRFVGTLVGAAVTLGLIGLLADQPALLFLLLGALVIGCTFLFMIDLMPRGYAYALVGVTALVVGFTTLPAPLSAFDVAVVRSEEILLGVLCAVVVDSICFPRPAGQLLNRQVAAWLDSAGALTRSALAAPAGVPAAVSRLAVDAATLDALSTHIAYDTVAVRPQSRVVRLLHTRMLRLISLIFAAGAWLEALRAELPGVHAEPAVAALHDWAEALPEPPAARIAAVRQSLLELQRPGDAGAPRAALLVSIGRLLDDLVVTWEACASLRRAVSDAAPLPAALRTAARSESLSIPYADKLRAGLVLLPSVLAFLLVFAYWSATGWSQGSTAALITLITGLLVGTSIEPVARARAVAWLFAAGAVLTLIYQFAVLPAVAGFPLLAFALGVFLIPVGAFIPITAGTATLLVVLTLLQLGLQPDYQAEFLPVLDALLGQLSGIALAAALAWLLAVPSAAWTARHLRRVGWSHLAAIAAGSDRPSEAAFARRALDRFAAIAAQLPVTGAASAGDLLAEMRVGVNMLHLQQARAVLPPAAAAAIGTLLADLARHFRLLRQGSGLSPDALRRQTHAAMLATEQALPAPAAETAWLSLAGTERWLFPAAPGQVLPEASHAR